MCNGNRNYNEVVFHTKNNALFICLAANTTRTIQGGQASFSLQFDELLNKNQKSRKNHESVFASFQFDGLFSNIATFVIFLKKIVFQTCLVTLYT